MLPKEVSCCSTGSIELTGPQSIELDPIQIDLVDAHNDDQIPDLFVCFEQYEKIPVAAPQAPVPALPQLPPPTVQPPPVQYTPTTDKDMSQDDISFALNNNNAFYIMAVINSEECELDRGICLSFYTPATAMSNILKLKKSRRN